MSLSPTPPANLVRYWSDRNAWLDCAQPLYDQGVGEVKVVQACGAKPARAAYGVPPNPYSASGGS